MFDNLRTGYPGVIFQELTDRFIDLSQIILIPSSVSFLRDSVVGSCHCPILVGVVTIPIVQDGTRVRSKTGKRGDPLFSIPMDTNMSGTA